MKNQTQVLMSARDASTKLPRVIRAANDNGGRHVVVKLQPSPAIVTAEIEVFGALLAELQATEINDNYQLGGAV